MNALESRGMAERVGEGPARFLKSLSGTELRRNRLNSKTFPLLLTSSADFDLPA